MSVTPPRGHTALLRLAFVTHDGIWFVPDSGAGSKETMAQLKILGGMSC
jgi:hypothetical protein